MKSPRFYFDAQPTYDYWIVNQHAQDGRIQRVVFRTANKSRSDRAVDALNRAVEKFARRRSDLPSDRIQAVPHDGRRGGEAVIDLVDDEVYAEGLPRVEAEELAGAIWNVAHDIARVNARAKTSRPNPTGAHRANPSEPDAGGGYWIYFSGNLNEEDPLDRGSFTERFFVDNRAERDLLMRYLRHTHPNNSIRETVIESFPEGVVPESGRPSPSNFVPKYRLSERADTRDRGMAKYAARGLLRHAAEWAKGSGTSMVVRRKTINLGTAPRINPRKSKRRTTRR